MELDPETRIVAVEAWDTGARTFELIELEDWRLQFSRSIVGVSAELALHGAVLFEVNPYDPLPPSLGDDTPPSDPRVWLARILIAAPVATLVLYDPGAAPARLVCAGKLNPHDGYFVIALCEVLTDPEQTQPEGGAVVCPGAVRTGAPVQFPVRFGDGSVLALRWPEGLERPQRDWSWAWRPTLGPVLLWVYVERTASELAAWFATTQPNGYVETEKNNYRHTGSLRAEIELADGWISWARAEGTPPPSLVEADAALLRALRDGALGPVSWDLYDGDYHFREATGGDSDSLAEYLDPASDAAALRARWKEQLAQRYIDASRATDLDEAASIICQEIWGQENPALPGEIRNQAGLLELLRSAAGASCPFYVRVRMPMGFVNAPEFNSFWRALTAARRRIQWGWEFKTS